MIVVILALLALKGGIAQNRLARNRAALLNRAVDVRSALLENPARAVVAAVSRVLHSRW